MSRRAKIITAEVVSYEGCTDGLRYGRLRLRGAGIPPNVSRHFAFDRLNNTIHLYRISETIDGTRDDALDNDPRYVAAASKAVAQWAAALAEMGAPR